MGDKLHPSPDQQEAPLSLMTIMAKYDGVGEEQIELFGKKLDKRVRWEFEGRTPEEYQRMLVFVASLSDKEIRFLAEKNPSYAVGFHDVRARLRKLHELTNDERYEHLLQEIGPERY